MNNSLKNLKKKSSLLFILLLLSPTMILAIETTTVTVSPDGTNEYGAYTIDSGISPFFNIVEANLDSIVLTFDSTTVLPATIDPSYVSINGVTSGGVTVAGQRVFILSPVLLQSIFTPVSFTIEVSAAAKIRNPATNGSYTIDIVAIESTGGTIDGPATSGSYTINIGTSTISTPSVAPSPSVVGQAAAYAISFNTGAGGFLSSGSSTITIAFDTSTAVPDGSLSGVTVNSTSATAIASNDTVVITTPVDVDNEISASINFSSGSGLLNPSIGGKYILGVKTSSENTFVESDSFNIANAGDFSISAINNSPTTVNNPAEYEIQFITSSTGALTASTDSVTIIFDQNTYIPSDISATDVLVATGGFSNIAASLTVFNDDASNSDTLIVGMPIPAGNTSTVTVTINTSAGMMNPSEAGNYTLGLHTTPDDNTIISNPYQISGTSTTVSQALVTPGVTTTDTPTNYTIDFNLGTSGRLQPGTSTIRLNFNGAYSISPNRTLYDSTLISVGEEAFVTLDTTSISINGSTIDITIPSSVITSNGDNIVLYIGGTGTEPISNPSAADLYAVGVSTSVETTEINSTTYTIGGTSVTFNSMSLTDSTVNTPSGYTINMTTQTALFSVFFGDDHVQVIFPEGTVLPSTIATNEVTINTANPSSVTVVPSTRTVTAKISQFTIGAGSVSIVFAETAGIINPAVPSASYYTATISTSKDIAPVSTRMYEIIGSNTQPTSVSASANPGARNVSDVAYTMNFTTSSTGKLAGGLAAGSSTITVDFDTVTVVPASISASTVKVNSTISSNVEVLASGNGGVIRVTVPDAMVIDSSTTAIVNFETAAGLDTRNYFGTFNVVVKTSSDTVYSDTTGTAGDYVITDSQDLSITSVSPNPLTQNATAGYSILFTTGSGGGLAIGDSIRLVFPANTTLPPLMSTSDILINSNSLSVTPTIEGDTLTIQTPVIINNLTSVTVLINQAAGILNPTLVQSYTMDIITSTEDGPFTSPLYNITQASSTVSTSNVTVDPVSPDSLASYTVNFNVGVNGRLVAGTSTIIITFNGSTTVGTTAADYDSSYIAVDGSAIEIDTDSISISGQAVTIIVPQAVSIDNGDAVSIILNQIGSTKPLRNPASTGNYTLKVRTSVETSDRTSNPYTITTASPVTKISTVLGSNVVNAESAYTISFRVQNAVGVPGGTVTIAFPFNTLLPASITTSTVTIASDPTNPTTFGNVSSVSTNTSTRIVTINLLTAIGATDSVRVAFANSAGLENPSITGNYTLTVRTSSQNVNGMSSAYTMTGAPTNILNLSVNVTPTTPGVDGRYEYSFNTNTYGRLVSGVSQIFLLFPDDVTLPGSTPSTTRVRVNGTAAGALEMRPRGVATSDPDTLVVTVPSSVTIGNMTDVDVVIDEAAGIQNASSGASLTYEAFTSVEGAASADFSLPVELTAFAVKSTEGIVYLNWTTESELENAYWMVQRAALTESEYEDIQDGDVRFEDLGLSFDNIATIDGQGSIAVETNYTYVDSLVEANMVYAYRLADVSYSGVVTIHEIVYQKVDAPLVFKLYKNYPNPFNPSTTIKYSLPIDAQVELKVFNVLGQEVIKLVDDVQKAGFHDFQWHGKNQVGNSVASGMYFVYFNANGLGSGKHFNQVMKVVFLK